MKKVSYIDSNLFSPKDAWDALSMAEKSEMMKVAVQNGITNLEDIRREYNEFAGGGYMDKAKALIKKNEGWMAKPYKDAPKGKSWRSVGYGFNDSGFYDKYPEGISRHYENGITKAQAEQELNYVLNKADKHLRSIYGKQWDSFNDNQKAAIMDTYYQRPASVGKKSAFYNAVKSGKDASKYLGVNGFADRNKKRQSVFGGGAVPMVADNIDTSLPQEVALQPIVENIPEFIPLNPQAFNTTLPTYQRPELTFEEPVIQEAPVSPYSPEEIERQERAEGLANLGRFLSFTNTSGSNNAFLNTIGMLTGNTFADGGKIHIDPSKKGTFTAAASKHGMGVQEFASKVLANKENYSPAMVKKANFARNASRWHGFGGNLYGSGGDRIVTTGGAGYVPPISSSAVEDAVSEASKKIMNYIKGAHDTSSYFSYDSSMEPYTGPAQDTYLLPRKSQEKEFLKRGYIKGENKDYGLVKKAVGSRNLPVYQRNPDVVSRNSLTVIGNVHGWDPWYGDSNTSLEHAGSYPTALYTDGEGNFYQKGWDLNDYGGKTGSTIGFISDIVDRIGSPVVVTTGYQPVKDPQSERFIQEITPMMAKKGLVPTEINGKTEWTLPGVIVYGKKKKKK